MPAYRVNFLFKHSLGGWSETYFTEEANITSAFYFTAADGVYGASGHRPNSVRAGTALRLLTFCVLVLRNGFTVTGESACVSPENFDAELGRKIARQNAIAKVWPLMGYALRESLCTANV